MTNLQQLALRIEGAGEGSRELDDEIATALFTDKHRVCIKGLSDEAGGMWMFRYPGGSIGSSLRFTASIDAALSLVPEGWGKTVADYFGDDGKPPFYADCCDLPALKRDDDTVIVTEAFAATPALALAAAALRAIDARQPEDTTHG